MISRVLGPVQGRRAAWVGNLCGMDGYLPVPVCANTPPGTAGYQYQVALRRTQNIRPRTYSGGHDLKMYV